MSTPVVTMRQLLESGVHFGHQTRRWNPKMKRFIFTERNGIYIIDLQKSLAFIDRAYDFVKETVAHGGTIMFVGTKKQAQEAIAEQAARVGMPYVNQRWLGGMLTNFSDRAQEAPASEGARGGRLRQRGRLGAHEEGAPHAPPREGEAERTLGGIRDMSRIPSAVWIVDTKKEHIGIGEARKLHIPVVAILDTNCDPDEVDYPIPGNDDAIRAVGLLTRVVADAVASGLMARAGANRGDDKPAVAGGAEPLAEWEQELLAARRPSSGRRGAAEAPRPSAEAEVTEAPEVAEAEVEAAPVAETVADERPLRPPRPRPSPPTRPTSRRSFVASPSSLCTACRTARPSGGCRTGT